MATKIMVVDDTQDTHDLIADYLTEYPARLISAKNGNQAIELLKDQGVVELILLDLMMPVMDGFKFLDTIRNQKIEAVSVVWEPGTTPEEMSARMEQETKIFNARMAVVPVIIISARDQKADIMQAKKYKIAGYLAKPFSEEILVERITQALGGKFGKTPFADVDRLLD